MKLKLFKPLWGHSGSNMEAIRLATDAGFDGIEGPIPTDRSERRDFVAMCSDAGLEIIAEVTTGGSYVPDPNATPAQHLDDLRRGIERSIPAKPKFINTQAGLDAWDAGTQIAFHSSIAEIAWEFQVEVVVETHRSRSTFNPWVTRDILNSVPDINLTCDFSHWCCVSERLVMDDNPALLTLMADRCHHTHARIGYDQGPQVPDPRAPEYANAVERHRAWWETIWNIQERKGIKEITMTPEFGTDGYLHLEPYTRKPVADLWEVNCWMGLQLRTWFEEMFARSMK